MSARMYTPPEDNALATYRVDGDRVFLNVTSEGLYSTGVRSLIGTLSHIARRMEARAGEAA